MRRSLALTCSVVLCSALNAQMPPNAFDLADACRGGDGSFPGTGTMDEYPINRTGAFVLAPGAYTFVVGTFPVLDTGLTDITDPAGSNPMQFDFGPYVGATANNGGPANGLATGTLAINDPSRQGLNPDYTGDPNNHSIMMCHASIGITFDLNAIRAVYPNFRWFGANAGSSCNPTGYVVLVDGDLVAAGGGNSGNSFHALTVPIPATAQYLTLASTDDNLATINCAHAYFGDPWLVPAPVGAAYGSLGGGCTNPIVGLRPVLTNQAGSLPAIGTTLVLEMTSTPGPVGGMILTTGFSLIQLPLPIGLPNCVTIVTPLAVAFAPYTNGIGTISIPIPMNPVLANTVFYNQAGALDPMSGPGVSNANCGIIQ